MDDLLSGKHSEIQAIRIANDPKSDLVEHYFRSITSFSHVMGTVTTILVNYIRSAFNDGFIKTIWNSMEELYSQRSKAFMDTMIKPRPILIIDPRFDLNDPGSFRPQEEFDMYVPNHPSEGFRLGMSMLDSRKVCEYNNYKLFCKPRRYKMTFNCHFIFDSDIQRLQCQEYIRQTIRHRYPNVLYQSIENVIPDEYMMEIARINHFNYKSKDFLDFLNTFTYYPITRRLRGGSGNYEFFWLVRSPIVITFNDQTADGPTKRGNLNYASTFSENVTVEFVASSLYYLVTAMKMGDPLYKDTITKDDIDDTGITHVGLTVANILDIPELDINNFKKYSSITLQADKNGDDTVNILQILKEDNIYHVYNYYKENNMKIDWINIEVIENFIHLNDERKIFNLDTFDLLIKDMDVYKTYHVVVYIDNRKIGKLMDDFYGTDKSELIRKDDK